MPDLMPRLRQLETQGLLRRRRVVTRSRAPYVEVDGKRLLAFCSNDYLGLADHPAIVEAAKNGLDTHGAGAGSSALIGGHTAAHAALEARLASFMGAPRALYFPTGYMANLGIVPALVGRGDAVFSDARNHACLIDAARLSRADVHIYPHGDMRALARMLAHCTRATKLVASDAVFSMDGDLAPLREVLALCERHDAWLLIDDAHGFGVHGERGRGTLAHLGLVPSPRVVYLGTLGKAAGVSGAFVAGEESLIEWLVQRARTYVFTTGSAPVLASALIASLDIIERDQWRREHLQALIARLRAKLAPLPWRLLTSTTAIQPLIVGDNHAAVALMDRLEERGIWVPAIRPPTVPKGTARLRISLSAAHSFDDVDRLGAALRALAPANRARMTA